MTPAPGSGAISRWLSTQMAVYCSPEAAAQMTWHAARGSRLRYATSR